MSASHITPQSLSAEKISLFWSRVDKDGPGGCWLWTGSIARNGYGLFSVRPYGVIGAHRLAWMLVNGSIPNGLLACHDCPNGDRRDCVNPAHLFLGTQQENQHDCTRKGRRCFGGRNGHQTKPERTLRGEESGHNTLNDLAVRAARRAREDGVSLDRLARWFGVSKTCIKRAVEGRTWAHLLD